MNNSRKYDCIIVGAGPGGLQAAIHLARYNRSVILFDSGGGRTRHALHLENYLGLKNTTGKSLVDTGFEQIQSFGVTTVRKDVTRVTGKKDNFEVLTRDDACYSRFVIAASGTSENIPGIHHMNRFFGRSFFTCIDCDGYRMRNKKALVIGNSLSAARNALAVKEMFSDQVGLILAGVDIPDDIKELLEEDGIRVTSGVVAELVGDEELEAVILQDGSRYECEVVLSGFGYKLNDNYLSELPLDRDGQEKKILVNRRNESSVSGLYITGALAPMNSQAIIAAGQGAVAAIDINKRLLEI